MADEHSLNGADEHEPDLSLSRAQRRREQAQRIEEGAPREGVAIFRPVERAVLVALHRSGHTEHAVDASLDELELLVETAGAVAAGRVVQKRNVPDVATFIGRGKVTELKALCSSLDADAAIFDDDLSPAQQRTLEERLGVKVLDRTIVILDIFAQHASSREGKAQVELAQLSYLLPRLRGWGASLSRQAGSGIGARRGPGETQLEVDRRKINRRITKLRTNLREFAATRRLKTKDRERHGVPTVALVGYTNAGKSTLLNRLTGSSVLVADQLFATLDTTARRLSLPDGREVVATDTVGFVKKLPTQLVEAFKSTLEDTLRANLLLHVVDAAHPEAEAQILAVDRVLAEIGADAMRRVLVLNKADVADRDTVLGLERRFAGAVAVSAVTGEGTGRLVARVAELLPPARRVVEAVVPYAHAELVAAAHRDGEVLKEEHRPEGTYVMASVGRSTGEALRPYASSDGWLGTQEVETS
ncbi:MAG: GTPase HflX [Actinomycetota bacterium]|nr:GTPase HflX [Euzebyales bacterium]MDQ3528683.1 GTPase HflX [Actinomycetota bacterium]